MPFSKLYILYVQKAERKQKTQEEVNQIIYWLMGYDMVSLQEKIESQISLQEFLNQAPQMNEKRTLIKGVVCGVRVEDVEDPMMREVRYLDKLIDELARGKRMDKILRT